MHTREHMHTEENMPRGIHGTMQGNGMKQGRRQRYWCNSIGYTMGRGEEEKKDNHNAVALSVSKMEKN